jgi:hypothetical protein
MKHIGFRVAVLWAAFGGVFACGGPEPAEQQQEDRASSCGPHGRLHRGPGVEPHCHCDDGYEVEEGRCVEVSVMTDRSTPDCGPNGVFDGRSCDCQAGYTQTGVGADRTCQAIPACLGANDPHEPNDEPATATPFPEVTGPLYACPTEADWFTFGVTAGDRVEVEVRFDGEEVDLDLFLFGPSSSDPRALSIEAAGDMERASFVARQEGTAGALVLPYGIGEGAYEMELRIEEGEAPMCAGPGGFCRTPADCCSGICHGDHCH